MLNYSVIKIKAKWLSSGWIPDFPGSTFRGSFGHSLKKVVCVRDGVCSGCHLKYDCAYSIVFESPVPNNSDLSIKYPNAPHPFVFKFPLGGVINKEDCFELQFTLFGNAIPLLQYFIYAIIEQGKRGLGRDRLTFDLIEVTDETGFVVYDRSESIISTNVNILEVPCLGTKPPEGSKSINLNFLSPCKLSHKGRISARFEPRAVAGNILRKYSMMNANYDNNKIDIDFKLWADKSSEVEIESDKTIPVHIKRWSNRQNRKMSFYGFQGSIKIKNCSCSLWQLLKIGQLFHVGKASAFGFGIIEIEEGV